MGNRLAISLQILAVKKKILHICINFQITLILNSLLLRPLGPEKQQKVMTFHFLILQSKQIPIFPASP